MKVVITDYEFNDINLEKGVLQEAGIELFDHQIKKSEDLPEILKDADGIITQYADLNKEVIMQLNNCKVIVRYGIGVDNIDIEAATKKGIYVCNVPNGSIDEVSNHTIALALLLVRKLFILRNTPSRKSIYQDAIPIYRLSGKILGLISFGTIPREIARKMQAFGLKIMTYDPYIDDSVCKKYHVEKVELETLLSCSDIISIHSPLTEQTKHMINRDAFAKMKSTAFLINTARGGIVKENDLFLALKNRQIAGAALDVFEKEPLDLNNPLLELENFIATPHVAWYSEESITTIQEAAAKEVVNVLEGNRPLNLVNKELL